MSAAFQIFTQPSQQALDTAANVLSGATLTFTLTGTSTPTNAYSNSTLVTPVANPLAANSAGVWIPIFLDPAIVYRIVLKTAAGAVLQTWDPANEQVLTAASLSTLLTQTLIGQKLYPQTAGEIAALPTAVVPTNTVYPPGEGLRQGANTVPGTTDMSTALQAAIDGADDVQAQVFLRDDIALAKPLLIRTTSQQNVAIVGNGRVSTILRPTAADIKVAPVSINALIINQNNNGHLHLSGVRCLDAAAYTGKFLYCLEGGGSDASGQALFSAVVDDCWFGFSSNNSGIFHGGFSNLMVARCVFESTKSGCFLIEGAGNSDHQYIGNVMNACYDSFLYGAADTVTKATITVDTLHAYQHLRGPLIEIKNVTGLRINNVILEPDAANVGTTGIAKLTDSNFSLTNINCLSRAGVPRAATCLEFVNAATGKIANVRTDATTGVKFSGTGALDLTFDNCDFSGCDNAVDWNSGTLSGKVTFRNCRFNDSQHYGLLVTAGTMSFDLTLINCEVVNAGLSGTATDRNFDLSTSGKVRLIRCKIGQDNGSAAATHYIRAQGSGTFEVIDPIPVGTPPTAFVTGSQTIKFDGVNSDMAGMIAFTPSLGGNTTYSVQVGYWMIARRVLYFWGQLTVTAIGTGSPNTISGLPYASSATSNLNGGGVIFEISGSNVNLTAAPTLLIGSNATSATIKGFTAAAAADGSVSVMANGTNVRFQGSYPLP